MPEDISNPQDISVRLSPILNKAPLEIEHLIQQGKKGKPYDPLIVARDITFEQVAKIETQMISLPGVSIEAIPEREYLYGALGCHVLFHESGHLPIQHVEDLRQHLNHRHMAPLGHEGLGGLHANQAATDDYGVFRSVRQ